MSICKEREGKERDDRDMRPDIEERQRFEDSSSSSSSSLLTAIIN